MWLWVCSRNLFFALVNAMRKDYSVKILKYFYRKKVNRRGFVECDKALITKVSINLAIISHPKSNWQVIVHSVIQLVLIDNN